MEFGDQPVGEEKGQGADHSHRAGPARDAGSVPVPAALPSHTALSISEPRSHSQNGLRINKGNGGCEFSRTFQVLFFGDIGK